MTTITLQVPTIHLNGTAASSLLDDLMEAGNALLKAMEALQRTAPHMRDYYVRFDPEGDFKAAQTAHGTRLDRLRRTHAELEAIATAIDRRETTVTLTDLLSG